jgi:crossover junction endodeoxyribonuclease RusA
MTLADQGALFAAPAQTPAPAGAAPRATAQTEAAEARPERDSITFSLGPGYTPSAKYDFFQCGANARHNRYVKAAITKQIRLDTKISARHKGLKPVAGVVTITAVQHPAPGKRTRDVENIAPLVKAMIDGLRDAGVLVNDSAKYVSAVTYTAGQRVPGGLLMLHIRPQGES